VRSFPNCEKRALPTHIPSVSTFTSVELTGSADPKRNPAGAAAFWLRRDIIRGVFAPGERLATEFLANFYKIGYSPMREAIVLLSSSDLTVHEHQRGRFVAQVSLHDWLDVEDIYLRTSKMALHIAMERGDLAWEERMVVSLYRSLRTVNSAPPTDPEQLEVWHMARRALHSDMRAGANSAVLSDFLSGLSDRLERYIYLFGDRSLESNRDHHTQNRVFVDALVSRDPTRLVNVMEEYFDYGKPVRDSVARRLAEAREPSRQRA
jgi:GntR family transcriptional regulator, carbon starvation induced regulator